MSVRKERKPNRLRNYNYSLDGAYFITICSKNRENIFGGIVNNKICPSSAGRIAVQCWNEIPSHFPYARLDESIIMPNHIHGIVIIRCHDFTIDQEQDVGNADLRSLRCSTMDSDALERTKMKLSKIIHGFKSSVTRIISKMALNPYFAWQKSYYDHIIRDEMSLVRIREYIINNPASWSKDVENLDYISRVPAKKRKEIKESFYRNLIYGK